MAKKGFCLGMLAMVLALGMAVLEVHAQSTNHDPVLADTWTNQNSGFTIAFNQNGAGYSIVQAHRLFRVDIAYRDSFGIYGDHFINVRARTASEAEEIARSEFRHVSTPTTRIIRIRATPIQF